MRAVVETEGDYPNFEIYISPANFLCISSESKEEAFFLPIKIEEAISMAEYVLEICKQHKKI